ncbi:homeobox protein onecut [Drosophila pseudoobscura]|uniref:One cut domain family member n=1 Tax=Drosophila pseudoobscura pseudoobscura TaxID=46245 RepID=A0A6I8UWS5_DROPS|nr:homeobox protein onecut [Drosophila pseudoobscura]XP_033237202.1 homeobox protein onecut [Drosophila pseudoobscura]
MESINEIMDSQTFSQELVDDEFITVGHQNQHQEADSESESHSLHGVSGEALAMTMQSMMSSADGAGEEEPSSVVMVIDEIAHSNVQTAYQIVPQQLQIQGRNLPLPLSLLHHQHQRQHQTQTQHQQRQERMIASSPVDFVGSDISLDGIASVNTVLSQGVSVKQEHKLLIVRRDQDFSHVRSQSQASKRHNMDEDVSNVGVGIMDELSSDGLACEEEEVTLNQHHQHQQLLEQQHQYGHLTHHQTHGQVHQSMHHRSAQLALGHNGSVHSEVLSVIVQSHEDDKDVEGDADEDDDDDRDSGGRGQLLSPVLEHSSYQTLTSVNDRISPPGFSPTSYATLTPIQPLPPISTMSDKFAYSGHISGGGGGGGGGGSRSGAEGTTNSSSSAAETGTVSSGNVSSSGCSNNDCSSFLLSGLSGVQSPYSSYDKLPSMISPPPPHNYSGSPSHGLTGMVVSCDLHTHSSSVSVPSPVTGGCVTLSPHSDSPQLQIGVNVNGQKRDAVTTHGHAHGHGNGHSHGLQLIPVTLQKQVICLSPTGVIGDSVVVSDYESSYSGHHHDHELIMATSSSTSSTAGLQHSPTLSPHSVSAGSVVSMSLHSPASVVTLPNINGSIQSLTAEMPVVVSLTPTPPPVTDDGAAGMRMNENDPSQRHQHFLPKSQDISGDQCSIHNNPHSANTSHQQSHQNGYQNVQQLSKSHSPKSNPGTSGGGSRSANASGSDMEEINTKELAQRISAELKRYSIPQAIFAQRVLCRSQGTLSDLLRNPKPWSKLKSGRETFRRMFKWLQEPEFQRMSALRMAAAQIPQRTPISGGTGVSGTSGPTGVTTTITATDSSPVMPTMTGNGLLSGSSSSSSSGGAVASIVNCRRKEEPQIEQMPHPKKPRLVFTDLQRRTLQAIFKETKRPSKEMQVTIARQLGLEPTTVGNFFMNARRRSMDKWRDDDTKNALHSMQNRQQQQDHNQNPSNNLSHANYANIHTTAMSPIGAFDDEADMELELDNSHDFDLVDDHGDNSDEHGDML